MKFKEFVKNTNIETITLNQLLDGEFDERELLAQFVGYVDLDKPLPIKEFSNEELKKLTNGETSIINAFKTATKDSKKLVNHYIKKLKNLNKYDKIIIVYDNRIIDGFHRTMAALLSNIGLPYVDLADLPE